MSYPLSDDDSTDSDSGIRFKTANTRDKLPSDPADDTSQSTRNYRDRYSSRRDEKHSSSGHHSHRSHRARSSDRSRGRRDRSRSREHRKRSPESLNSVSSGSRAEGDRRKGEKSGRSSNREYDRSRSRGNSPDRAYAEKVRGSHYDEQLTKNTPRSGYRSMSDDEGTRRTRHKSESDGSQSEKDTSCSTSPYIEYLRYLDTSSEAMPASTRSSAESLSSQDRTRHLRREVKCPKKLQCQEPVSPSYIEYLENVKTSPEKKHKRERCPRKSGKKSKTRAPTKRDSDESVPTGCVETSCGKPDDAAFGPTLPPRVPRPSEPEDPYGPALPQQLSKQTNAKQAVDIEDFVIVWPTAKRQTANDGGDVVLVAVTAPFENDEYIIGPALPPHLQEAKASGSSRETETKAGDDEVIEPTGSKKPEDSESTATSSPAKPQVIGPVLPPHLRAALLESAEENAEFILPDDHQPDSEDDDDDDEVIGPLPAGSSGKTRAHTELEERALQMKLDSLKQSKDERTVREEWMLELPQVQAANLGLGPRQFRAKGVPDMSDRSSWTDTPQDKAKKKVEPPKIDIKREAELRMIKERDVEQQCLVEKHKKKKKRDKSLLDVHQEEYNRKKKKDLASGINERRPFDRDIDLKANRFDEAQKKAILKKAQLLDNRFSSGESKFL